MPTLVILTPGFPKDEDDTACLPAFQQFALSLKKKLSADQFLILSFQYPFEKKEYTWNGIRVIAVGGNNKPGFHRLLTWLRTYAILKKIHKKETIRGIFSLWLSECSLVGKIFAKRNRLKHYSWLIGQDAKKSNQYISRIRPQGSEIVAMSDFLKKEFFKNHGETPFMVAENGITESSFPVLNKGIRTIDILAVGSLIKLKNHELFIETVFELKDSFPDLKTTIVGMGEEEENLKNLAKEKGLEDNITFAGLVPHQHVFDLMNNARVFLHTSHYEGNSTVLMEALYCGCKVFSTCPLSDRSTPNLTVLNHREDLVKSIRETMQAEHIAERVVFNTMDASTEKILSLF